MRHQLAALTAALLLAASTAPAASAEDRNLVTVSSTQELLDALENAKAGDEIVLREGIYQNDKWYGKWAAFWAEADGTPEHPIILRSEDPAHPATICGVTQENKYALNIIGSYWEIRDLKVCEAAKGIFLQRSEHSIISGCEVCEIGQEGIHIIDNSSYNLVTDCRIHDTGTTTPKYGEGVYIGSAKNATDYGFDCHYNTVRGCSFGPNIAADHVDIKEYTLGNTVEYCTFDGTGMQGENGGDSFVEVKGNHAVIRYNTGYRNGCEKLLYAFDMNVQIEGWGQDTLIYGNTVHLDTEEVYLAKGWNCAAAVFRNRTEPESCACSGNLIMQADRVLLPGDADGDGILNTADAVCLRDYLLGRTVPYLDAENADLCTDSRINAKDLSAVKRKILSGETDEPAYAVHFEKEAAGKWRMTDGLGGKSVTVTLSGTPGMSLNLGWGYYDPNAVNEETGKTGTWVGFGLGTKPLDETGECTVTVELPEYTTRMAVEVWDYLDGNTKLDKDGVQLKTVLASAIRR